MIARIWHGYTTKQNGKAYEDLLQAEIFKIIAAKKIKGYKGIKLLKKERADEFEFITIMSFVDVDSIKEFMGDDYETAFVLPEAQELLKRYDKLVTHYEVVHDLSY
jgi:antibiotic biosynthesis monooxygenase (ABM) superfamily enzyme